MTDFYGRPLRSNGGPAQAGYFDDSTSYYAAEPRDNDPSRQEDSSSTPKRSPTTKYDKMASTAGPSALEGVSPDLIAAITEKVKKELLEHLKQTGNLEEQTRAPPMQRDPSSKSSSTSSPPPNSRRVYTPPSPQVRQSNAMPAESMRSPPSSPLEKPGVRFSDRGYSSRPPAGNRTYSTMELSTIDQKWRRLFESDGTPTKRLGEFLRGLANHIIEDFSPKKSIVVMPSKMAEYYSSHALDNEVQPLLSMFRAGTNEHISRLYQDLGCEHHLIQEDSRSAPVIPSLTPVGFAQWMTIQILAYPDQESKRLDNVVLAIPIDADGELVDGKPERLPKQISRYLLPDKADPKSKKLVEEAIGNFLDDLGSGPRRKASITSPPPLSRHSSTSQTRTRPVPVEIHQAKTSPTTAKPNPLERERKPYSSTPAASESSTNEEPIKIERDRAPYTAKEGSGKTYAEPTSRPGRANSTSTRNTTRTQPENTEPRHHRAPSNSDRYMPPPRSRPRRTSSPPLKSFSHSTPNDIHNPKYGPDPSSSSSSFTNQSQSFNPGSYGSTGSFPPPPSGPPPVDIHRRSRDERAYRRDADDDLRFVNTGEFSSPRDAERFDRYQDLRSGEADRFDRSYERPIDLRGAPPDEWYRDKGVRGPEYEPPFGRRY
ncbi:uncharacterized protein PAC_02874 [Phialocephala subalpina]|uniref:DUF7514 domain-containing protein n=1 Tax=Phialocephala subalpina TaxID=576137 RepID=A0A1L7WJQ1_9HELO|nr:uncharacterized protein PAC_02874 [Phialocephala subalpina]